MTPAPAGPAEALADAAATHAPRPRRVLVAFSGGPDSTLLLAHALAHWPKRRLAALHVHHGWHERADAWADHCRRQARALGARCRVIRVDAADRSGRGPEAAAREARYGALAQHLGPDDVLVTAHHRDDQAESMLLALLRGGGVHGWAGMPVCAELGRGIHLRPWLGIARASLRAELEARGLDAVEDPANSDPTYERAWLRQQVLPTLRARWSHIDATLARAAGQAAEAAEGVDALAARDYAHCRGAVDATLDTAALAALPAHRQRALLRWWLVRAGLARPPARRLESLRRQLVAAGAQRSPHVRWPGGEVRAWRGLAWAMYPLPAVETGAVYRWHDPTRPLALPHRWVTPAELAAHGVEPSGVTSLEVRLPAGGERFHPAGGARPEPLRELLRRAGWPPWQRARAPLVYADGACVAVVGLAGAAGSGQGR
jgi:tRNA(Ile)-lysidine synthase